MTLAILSILIGLGLLIILIALDTESLDTILKAIGRFLQYTVVRPFKFCVKLLALAMVINIVVYLIAPTYIIPVYQTINGAFHDRYVTDPDDVKRIFNKIKRLLPMEVAHQLTLTVVTSGKPNAMVNGKGQVFITTGMLNKAHYDEGAIAAVLGHEIAHYMLNHVTLSITLSEKTIMHKNPWKELMADKMGLLLAKSAGYNSCNVRYLWDAMIETYGKRLYNSTHPIPQYRRDMVKELCKHII